MYHMDHPSTAQSLEEFSKTVTEGLNLLSPLVLIMDREQFFIEEELLDPRINTTKMSAHFKKAGIQSVSFEKGVKSSELEKFVTIFTDLNNYPTPEAMKTALVKEGVFNIKINHVFFRKVTADDEVVSRDKLKEAPPDIPKTAPGSVDEGIVKMMAGSLVMDELEKSLSIQNLMQNPREFSKVLIDTDLSRYQDNQVGEPHPGLLLANQLHKIREEVESADSNLEVVNLSELAEAVFDMRKNLLERIEAQKAMGVVYTEEGMIRHEANGLTDQVIVRLVKEEYKQGKISIPRLAQILRRILPEAGELRRLLPVLKKSLLAEGMSLSEFLHLVQELGKELQSEGLVQVLEQGAEEIGLSGEDLVNEIKRDPRGAAELIALAAEIRRGAGDERVLTDLLVDYVERVGSELALDAAKQSGEEGGRHLRDVITKVETELVDRLRKRDVDDRVLSTVEQKLKEHMEELSKKLKSNWIISQFSALSPGAINKTAILRVVEKSVEDEGERQTVLGEVLSALRNRGVNESTIQQIVREIEGRKRDVQKEREEKSLPKGAFNRGTTLFFLKREIAQSLRYNTLFSGVLFSAVKIIAKKPVPSGSVKRDEVKSVVLERLVKIVRDTDMVGSLDENKMFVLLPMTEEKGANPALQRILKALYADLFMVRDIPLEVKLAGVTTAFSRERTPTLKDFLTAIETDLNAVVKSLRESDSH